MNHYKISIESFPDTFEELRPLYEKAYKEMMENLPSGILREKYDPWISAYLEAHEAKTLILFVVRLEGIAVGYCIMFISQDTKDSKLIAYEDYIYLQPEHRKGLGKLLVKFIVNELRARGINRIYIFPIPSTGLYKVWGRMGFRVTGIAMEMSL